MNDLFWTLPISILTGVVAYYSGVRKHRTDQHWSKRFEVYAQLIFALQEAVMYQMSLYDSLLMGSEAAPYPEYKPYREAKDLIHRLRLVPGWTISEETAEILARPFPGFNKVGIDEDFSNLADFEKCGLVADFYKKNLEDVVAAARADLGLSRGSRRKRLVSWLRHNLPVDWL